MKNEIIFSKKSGGSPRGVEKITWESSVTADVHTSAGNVAGQRWQGKIIATELPCEKFNGTTPLDEVMRWRKFRHQDGTVFYYGWLRGTSDAVAYAEIRLA